MLNQTMDVTPLFVAGFYIYSLVHEAFRSHAALSHVVYGVVDVGQEIERAF